MPKNRPTAAQRARQRQAADGGVYTDLLHSMSTPEPTSTEAWLTAIMDHLHALGWPAAACEPCDDRWRADYGPVALEARCDDGDPRGSKAPARLIVVTPPAPDGVHLGIKAFAGDESPKRIAVRVDAELAAARGRCVQGVETNSTTPCPICADRYPAHHLLATSPEGTPVCSACAWDGDNQWRADLPYLAAQIDELLNQDLAAPAGWSAVAAVLALTCGANLGRRLQRELDRRGEGQIATPRWDEPLDRSWLWLAPRERRHAAFAGLGAAASVAAITEALERYDPTLPQRARRVCQQEQVRWRPALWPAACAYALAFTTQSLERDRHRKPVHLVDSLSDGLSQIRAPFAVGGDALNVEAGLQQILEYLLFPLLMGHGLRDEPRDEQQRIYGATEHDTRAPRSRSDARISHELDRASQVAVVLGRIPGVPNAEVIWEGQGAPERDEIPLGSTRPVNGLIDELRQAARIQAAEQMYDAAGGIAMIADEAWSRSGRWMPADDAAHAVRQARQFLAQQPHADVLWAGPGGGLPEPRWIRVQVIEVNEHSAGAQDVPWLRVRDGDSMFGMRLCDIAVLQRAEPGDEPRSKFAPPAANPVAKPTTPSAEELSQLIDQYLHLASHLFGPGWKTVDHSAYDTSRQLLSALEQEHSGHLLTSFKMSIDLFDTWHECPSGNARKSPAIALTGKPLEVEFTFVKHDPACCDAPYACEIANELSALVTVLALFGGTVEARPAMPEGRQDDALRMAETFWQVEDWTAQEVCRRVWRCDHDAPGGGVMELDTNPPYLPPWSIAEGWIVPEGATATEDAVPPPGWTPRAAAENRTPA